MWANTHAQHRVRGVSNGLFHFNDTSILRVNNKHVCWNSKELLGLVVVSAGKPITLKLQCSFRLWHLLNWVQGALGGQKGACFCYSISERSCMCSNEEGRIEKSHFPPNTISMWHQTEQKEAQGQEEIWDEFCSSPQDGNTNGCLWLMYAQGHTCNCNSQ